MSKNKILHCIIGDHPEIDGKKQVAVLWSLDRKTEELFSYWKDEIRFYPNELIGLTKQEAIDLFHKKDVAYLQS